MGFESTAHEEDTCGVSHIALQRKVNIPGTAFSVKRRFRRARPDLPVNADAITRQEARQRPFDSDAATACLIWSPSRSLAISRPSGPMSKTAGRDRTPKAAAIGFGSSLLPRYRCSQASLCRGDTPRHRLGREILVSPFLSVVSRTNILYHCGIVTTTVAPGTGRPSGLKTVPETETPVFMTCSIENARAFAAVVRSWLVM